MGILETLTKTLDREAELQRRELNYGQLRSESDTSITIGELRSLLIEARQAIILRQFVTAVECLNVAIDEIK